MYGIHSYMKCFAKGLSRMKNNDTNDLIAEWVRKAEGDYLTASRELSFTDPVTDTICFHCQQAAEKYLKAYLIYLDIDFPYTHEIGDLVALLIPHDPEIGHFTETADALTDYAVDIRYPDDSAAPTIEEARTAFQTCTQLRQLIRSRNPALAIERKHA